MTTELLGVALAFVLAVVGATLGYLVRRLIGGLDQSVKGVRDDLKGLLDRSDLRLNALEHWRIRCEAREGHGG